MKIFGIIVAILLMVSLVVSLRSLSKFWAQLTHYKDFNLKYLSYFFCGVITFGALFNIVTEYPDFFGLKVVPNNQTLEKQKALSLLQDKKVKAKTETDS